MATARGVASTAVIVVAAVLLPLSIVSGWARTQVVDEDAFAATLAPLSQAGSKIGVNSSPAPDEAYSAAFCRAWASSDLAEGQRAFGERRTPRFEGR